MHPALDIGLMLQLRKALEALALEALALDQLKALEIPKNALAPGINMTVQIVQIEKNRIQVVYVIKSRLLSKKHLAGYSRT